jgi:hypothetical protein
MSDSLFCCGIGALSKLAIGKTGSSFNRLDFLDFTPQIIKEYADGSKRAIRGSLDHSSVTVAEGPLHLRFRTKFWLTAAKMDLLLPSLGFTVSGDTWTIQDSIPESTVILTPSGAPDNTFTGCIPSDFVMQGQKGQNPILIDIGWIGSQWTQQTNGTYSYGSLNEGFPYAFAVTPNTGYADTITLGSPYSNTLAVPMFRVQMDFHTLVEHNNSVFATNICPSDHDLSVSTSTIYTTCDGTTNLITLPLGAPSSAVPDVAGCSLTWNLQNQAGGSNNQTQLVIANVKPSVRFPRVVKNEYNRLPINFGGFAVPGGAASMVFTNVSSGV